MAYKKTYNPCDDCIYRFSKNNQESNMCKKCEFADVLDSINRLKEENERLRYGLETVLNDIRDYNCD